MPEPAIATSSAKRAAASNSVLSTPARLRAALEAWNRPRTVAIANKVDTNGGLAIANIVPVGATAIAYNLTIVNTVGTNGYLVLNPGGVTAVSASSINWSASGLSLANASVVPVSASREVTVICGGTSTSCNFIIDVVGYYQ